MFKVLKKYNFGWRQGKHEDMRSLCIRPRLYCIPPCPCLLICNHIIIIDAQIKVDGKGNKGNELQSLRDLLSSYCSQITQLCCDWLKDE